MVGESKILTVSYGAFSCTLEGFEDPFSTMKAIAEYFRDLSAQDRYFGAEPPQPDADILHKIAEQTIQSRVNAEVSDNSLILRQDHSAAKDQPSTFDKPGADADMASDDGTASTHSSAAFGDGDTIAAKLQRIRAVVSRDAAAPLAGAAFFSEDEHAEQFAPEADHSMGEDVAGASPASEIPAEHETAANADHMAAEAPGDGKSSSVSNFLSGLKLDDATANDNERAETDEEMLGDAAQADSAEDRAEDRVEDVPDEAAAEAEAQPEGDAVDAVPQRRITVQKISRAEVEAAQPDFAADATDLANGVDTDAPDLSEEAEAALMRELASVEDDMVAASDENAPTALANADTDADAEEVVEPSDDTADMTEETTGENVSDEETAVANVLAEHDAEDDATASEDDDEDDQGPARHGRAALLVEDEDAALNRLMDATSSLMSDDEGAGRRASIAHLKAAVAATKADESIAKAAADEDARELDQYRDDLARVVRPRSEARPVPNRPAPLVLVSEQRIDESEVDAGAHAASAVQPRRISSNGNLALDADFDDEAARSELRSAAVEAFGDYATRHKALELPDLLEAAAAYFTFVEGTGEFTRPMLMRKISSVDAVEAPSREDGLRSFGALLRESRIVKDGNGKFVLAESSRFAKEVAGEDA